MLVMTFAIGICVLIFIIGWLIKWGYDDRIRIISLTDDITKLQQKNKELQQMNSDLQTSLETNTHPSSEQQ